MIDANQVFEKTIELLTNLQIETDEMVIESPGDESKINDLEFFSQFNYNKLDNRLIILPTTKYKQKLCQDGYFYTIEKKSSNDTKFKCNGRAITERIRI